VDLLCPATTVWHDPGMTEMSMGSNIAVPVPAVRATLRWTGGAGVPDVDCSALLLEDTGEVGSDADFVFYNQPTHYTGAVRLAGKTPPPQASDTIDVDLARVPGEYQRVVLLASADGGTFGQVPDLQLLLSDLASGQPIASFPMRASSETAFLGGELYRRDGQWKFRAIGQGYASGLAGLASDFGIDVGEPAPSGPAAAPAPSSTPAPDAAPAPDPAPAPATTPATTSLDLAAAAPPGPDTSLELDAAPPTAPFAPPPSAPAPPPAFPSAPPAAPVPSGAWPSPPPEWAPPPAPTPAPAPPMTYPPPQQFAPSTPPPQPFSPPPPPPPPQPPAQTAPTVSLVKNERRELVHSSGRPLTRVVFSLGWTPAEGRSDIDLDASVIAFDANAQKLAIVWYLHMSEFYGALQHTGDNRKGGVGGDAEQILVDLARLPVNVQSLVFTINSFRKQTFTDVANAYCVVRDVDTGEELVRFDLSDTQPSTAVLMAELRRTEQPGSWRVRAIGEFHDYRTVKKLVPSAARQVRIGG
jgi:stress response protein SCP2